MDHRVRVSCAGKMAYQILSARSSGVVYAVFQRAYYLKKTDKFSGTTELVESNSAEQTLSIERTTPVAINISPSLCCIGQAELERGPLNVSTLHCPPLPVAVGEHWHSDQQLVTIGSIELDLTHTNIWQPTPTHQGTNVHRESVEFLSQFLIRNAQSTKAQTRVEKLIDKQLLNASKKLQQWLNNTINNQPADRFPDNLLGCGDGLTPAGDDIVVGVLLAFHAWNSPILDTLIAEVTDRINTTSEISAAHLLAACSGGGIEPLHRLIETISTRRTQQLNSNYRKQLLEAANTLTNYGHSSGYHAMQGVLIAAGKYPVGPS